LTKDASFMVDENLWPNEMHHRTRTLYNMTAKRAVGFLADPHVSEVRLCALPGHSAPDVLGTGAWVSAQSNAALASQWLQSQQALLANAEAGLYTIDHREVHDLRGPNETIHACALTPCLSMLCPMHAISPHV
jgi:hypothetical protein